MIVSKGVNLNQIFLVLKIDPKAKLISRDIEYRSHWIGYKEFLKNSDLIEREVILSNPGTEGIQIFTIPVNDLR